MMLRSTSSANRRESVAYADDDAEGLEALVPGLLLSRLDPSLTTDPTPVSEASAHRRTRAERQWEEQLSAGQGIRPDADGDVHANPPERIACVVAAEEAV